MFEIRKLTHDDMKTAAKLSEYAFGYYSDAVPSDESVEWRDPDDYIGGFVDGELIAKVAILPFRQNMRGVIKSSAGIGSVSTDPAHQLRGYSKQLLQMAFAEMRERGLVISSLYPFLESFYAKFGYVVSNDYLWIKFKTVYLQHYLPFSNLADGWVYEKLTAKENEPVWREVLELVAPRYHGYVLRGKVPDYLWRQHIAKDQHLILVRNNGRIAAAARYKIEGNMAWGKLTINEIYWLTLAGRDALFGYFARHIVNLPKAEMFVPMGVTFQKWFSDPSADYDTTVDYANMMCRVVDPVGAIADLSVGQNGRFSFTYTDPYCPWVDGSYEIVAENGRLHATKATNATASLTVEGLSALLFGTHSIEEVLHLGWASHVDDKQQQLLASWFPPLPVFNPNKF